MTAATPDWNDLRDILLIANTGSLSAAARRAGVSQSTMSRRLAVLEAGGRSLFLRDETGRLMPNEQGQHLVRAAREMAAVYDRLRDTLPVATQSLRIAACATAAALFMEDALPEWIGASTVPTELEVIDDLLEIDPRRYEVLVTLMGSVPQHSAGVLLGQVDWGLYAAPDYRRDVPWRGTLEGHRVLRAAGSLATVDAYRWLSRQAGTVAMLASQPASMAQLAVKGAGVALLPRRIGDVQAGLLLLQDAPCGPSDVWMIADAKEAVKPAVSSLFKWARGRFRPPVQRRSA